MNPRCVENEMPQAEYAGTGMVMNMGMGMSDSCGCPCPPVYECPVERVCERVIMHEVPHVVPINTKIINHHVYRHTFTPCYTMSECDTCENVYDQCGCKNF